LKEFEAAKKVCDLYEKDLFGSERTIETKKQSAKLGIIDQSLTSDCEMTYGDGRAEIQSIWMEDSSGERSNVFATGIEIAVCYRVSVQQALDSLIFAMMIKTREGICVYGTDSKHLDCSVDQAAANEFINVKFSLQNNLAPGIYYLNCGLRDEAHTFIHRRIDTLVFRVIADKATTAITGVSELAARLIIDKSS
jgi:lipopolysaccharide transport system ATP-binding protein